MKPNPAPLALIAPAFVMLSCAAPKAIVVEETRDKPKVEKKEELISATEASTPVAPDDGIRLPDMLGMPGEGEFRTNRPATGGTPGSGAVIARPPVETQR